jgi:hypothetical protein
MEEPKTFLARHPTLNYCVLVALGIFGVYLSLPIFNDPQSTIEWIDFAINLAIFIPSVFIAVVSALLAILSAVFSYRLDEEGWFAKVAHALFKAFGLPRLLLPEFLVTSPLGMLVAIFTRKYSEDSTPRPRPPR